MAIRHYLIFGLITLAVVVAWLYWATSFNWILRILLESQLYTTFFGNEVSELTDVSKRGTWGDSFGAFNSLFSALGFCAIFATLVMQGRALKIQQKDIHRQRFEDNFYKLLELLRQLRGELRYHHSQSYIKVLGSTASVAANGRSIAPNSSEAPVGHAAITSALRELRFWLLTNRRGKQSIRLSEVRTIYLTHVHTSVNDVTFGPYFRIMYTVLRTIRDDETLSKDDKERYGNLLRSQINTHELALISISCLNPAANDFRELLTYFHFLRYLPEGRFKRVVSGFHFPKIFAPRPRKQSFLTKIGLQAEGLVMHMQLDRLVRYLREKATR